MATSHNGWPVITTGLWSLPAITGSVKSGSVWVVLNWLANQYSNRVEPIVKSNSWGYSYRKITGGSSLWSNHASGTAVDFNAPKHPYNTNATANFTASQIATCNALIAESGNIVKWLNTTDPMHWEIRPGITVAQVDKFATKLLQRALGITDDGIRGDDTIKVLKAFQSAHNLTVDGQDGPATWAVLGGTPASQPPAPVPTPPTTAPTFPLASGQYYGPEKPTTNSKSVSGYWNNGKRDAKGNAGLKVWQQKMRDLGYAISADGLYGNQTASAAKSFQAKKGLRPDGLIGQDTWKATWS